jgi:formate dehydrogenase iron-sulfur subunit
MSITIYVPCDSSAVSLGADRVAAAIAKEANKRSIDICLIRNGSRGLFWLEPLVEVVTEEGRTAYGPVQISDVYQACLMPIFFRAAHIVCPWG